MNWNVYNSSEQHSGPWKHWLLSAKCFFTSWNIRNAWPPPFKVSLKSHVCCIWLLSINFPFFPRLTLGYIDGWDVCAQLGQCETYSQLSARQELMAFALTHCPPSSIQNLLAASSSLQTQVPFCPLRCIVSLTILYMQRDRWLLDSTYYFCMKAYMYCIISGY